MRTEKLYDVAVTLRRILPLFLGIGFLIYGYGVLTNGFVEWDDFGLILNNDFVKHPTPRVFFAYDPELYIPLTFLSYQIEYALFGATQQIFHFTNLMLHIGSAVLVYLIMQRVMVRTDGAVRLELIVALLFLVHPINAEAVSWAAARKDVLASFFALLSLHLYLQDRRRLSVAAFALALLAKVSIVLLPGVLLLVDWYRKKFPLSTGEGSAFAPLRGAPADRQGEGRWKVLAPYIPYLLLSAVFIVIALLGKPGSETYLLDKILLGTRAMLLYLKMIILPTGFSVLYPFTEPMTMTNLKLLFPLIIVILLSVAALLFRNRVRALSFAWGFYVFSVLPSFGNPVKGDEYLKDLYIGSDRYAYLASIPIFFLFALFVSHIRKKIPSPFPRVLDASVLIILIVLSVLSFRQSLTWHDSEALFRNVLRVAPNAQLAHNNIGGFLYERGEYEEAQWHFEQSVLIRPTGRAFFNLGQVYVKKGDKTRAMESFAWAYTYDPTHASALVNYAALKLDALDAAEASRALKQALEIDPEHIDALFNLGVALEKLGDREGAAAAFRKLLELDPTDEEAMRKLREID